MWINWLEPQATHCRESLPAEATPKPASHLSPQGQTYSWLPGIFPMMPMATLPFLLCSGLENQIKPSSLVGALDSLLSAEHALSHLNFTTGPRKVRPGLALLQLRGLLHSGHVSALTAGMSTGVGHREQGLLVHKRS